MFVAAAPALAQETAPVDPVSGLRLPLLPGEVVFRLRGGCGAVVPPDQVEVTKKAGLDKTTWYGACKFGLVDGQGYFFTEGLDYRAIGWTTPYQAANAHLGRILAASTSGDKDSARLSVSLGGGVGESVSAVEGLVPPPGSFRERMESFASVLERNGKFGTLILASRYRTVSGRTDSDYLRIDKAACPLVEPAKIASSVATVGAGVPLNAAQIKAVVSFCTVAINRLKQEGRVSGNSAWWDFQAFEKVDYGYFFVIFVDRDARMTAADNTVTLIEIPPKQRYSDVTLCPQLASLASCEPVWRALQQPYIQRRQEVRELISSAERAAIMERERRFAPLNAALKQKIMAMVQRRGTSTEGNGQ